MPDSGSISVLPAVFLSCGILDNTIWTPSAWGSLGMQRCSGHLHSQSRMQMQCKSFSEWHIRHWQSTSSLACQVRLWTGLSADLTVYYNLVQKSYDTYEKHIAGMRKHMTGWKSPHMENLLAATQRDSVLISHIYERCAP